MNESIYKKTHRKTCRSVAKKTIRKSRACGLVAENRKLKLPESLSDQIGGQDKIKQFLDNELEILKLKRVSKGG